MVETIQHIYTVILIVSVQSLAGEWGGGGVRAAGVLILHQCGQIRAVLEKRHEI